MQHLPAPPAFTLPPPPMPPLEFFDSQIFSQLSCSSIRHRPNASSNSRLILISSIVFLIIALLFTLLLIVIQLYRQRKVPSSTSTIKTTRPGPSVPTSRSYETISSKHTGVYLESIDTSATTYSTDPSQSICLHCQQEREHRIGSPPPPFYHILDVHAS
jgi:hypothetical protein